MTFGGGTALAAVFLHHRTSEALDFFAMREIEQHEILPLVKVLAVQGIVVDQSIDGPRRILVLTRRTKPVGHVDISFYPFDPIGRPVPWRGLRVDSLTDMVVNKIQAILTRRKPRDFVDLLFLLREGPERDLDRLLTFVRSKFGTGADRFTLAEAFVQSSNVSELPPTLRTISLDELKRYFERLARQLVRKK